jgi:dTDP-4-amino-4,6-dideoxygalactose transaminase
MEGSMSPAVPDEIIPCIHPYFEMDDAGLASIASLLASGRVSNHGPQVQAFERALADYLRVPETVAVSNGSDALLLSLQALQLPPGRVILPAYTYVATLNAVVQAGFEPVFCDVDPASFTMDSAHLTELLAQHADVRCVLPVNVFGVPPDLAAIRACCHSSGGRILYDNAHGFGTETNGQRLAPEPDVQTFSFHATKTLPAVEGGLIVTQDSGILSRVRRMRNHGLGAVPAEMIPGFNSKMDEIRAVIGLHSLRHFPDSLARRRAYGHRLGHAFSRFPDIYTVQSIPPGVDTNFQNLGVRCAPAGRLGLARVVDLFKSQGVGVRSYFDPPLHHFPGFDRGPKLPVTESIWRTLLSVPIHSRMSDSVLERIEAAAAWVAQAPAATGP